MVFPCLLRYETQPPKGLLPPFWLCLMPLFGCVSLSWSVFPVGKSSDVNLTPRSVGEKKNDVTLTSSTQLQVVQHALIILFFGW